MLLLWHYFELFCNKIQHQPGRTKMYFLADWPNGQTNELESIIVIITVYCHQSSKDKTSTRGRYIAINHCINLSDAAGRNEIHLVPYCLLVPRGTLDKCAQISLEGGRGAALFTGVSDSWVPVNKSYSPQDQCYTTSSTCRWGHPWRCSNYFRSVFFHHLQLTWLPGHPGGKYM